MEWAGSDIASVGGVADGRALPRSQGEHLPARNLKLWPCSNAVRRVVNVHRVNDTLRQTRAHSDAGGSGARPPSVVSYDRHLPVPIVHHRNSESGAAKVRWANPRNPFSLVRLSPNAASMARTQRRERDIVRTRLGYTCEKTSFSHVIAA